MKNSKTACIQIILMMFFLVIFQGFAQESILNDDDLIFQTTPVSTIGATYGLNGVSLQNGFGLGLFNSGLVQVGDDLKFSKLEGPKLSISEAAIIPARTTELDKEYLSFFTQGIDMSLENWKIGRTADGTSPPESNLEITRNAVAVGGGATFGYAVVINPDLEVAIGGNDPTQRLDVNGNARFRNIGTGTSANDLRVTSSGVLTTNTSDARLKKEIQTIDNALNKVKNLQGISFLWKADTAIGRQLGLLAQDVKEVVPEIVFKNGDYYGVDYSELIPVLIEAIKEQQDLIENQQMEIEQLQHIEERVLRLEKDSLKIN